MSTLKVNTILSETPTVNITDGLSVTGVSTVAALNATSIVNNTQLSHRNKIINGAVTIAQRGTSFSPGASDQKYFIDQFQHIATTGAAFDATVTQSTSAPDGFDRSYKVTPDATDTPTGSGNACFRMKIEGQDCQDLDYGSSSAKQVTVSFYAKSASANNGDQYTFQLRHFATDGTQRSQNAAFTITSSFQRFTFTFDGDTAVDIINTDALGMELDWHLAAGSDDIASQQTSWTTTNLFTCVTGQSNFLDSTNNEFYVTGVQLEIGSVATPFEHRTVGEELERCSRYYHRINASNLSYFGVGNIDGGNEAQILVDFVTEMRVSPTSLETSGTANHYSIRVRGNATGTSIPTIAQRTTKNSMVIFTASSHGFTDGQACFGRSASNDAFLGFSAEL